MTLTPEIPVIIVAYGRAWDVNRCMCALARMGSDPPLAIFICENGGADAFSELVGVLTGPEGTCDADTLPPPSPAPRFLRSERLRLRVDNSSKTVSVRVGEASENLGYAGGVNAYLEQLLATSDWPGVWILNPDTEPEPGALKELVCYATTHSRDMVGSRQRRRDEPEIVLSRGLTWRKWRAATGSVDRRVPATVCPPTDETDKRLDSPSGGSMYITRSCIERIGLMDERYFLYYEDLDWGLRAKKKGQIGYAHHSVVVHDGGATIGGGLSRRRDSPLSVYLEFRNRLLFTRVHFPKRIPWTFFMEAAEIIEYARVGSFRNASAALQGVAAGIIGRTGRPDHFMRLHRPTSTERGDENSVRLGEV